MLLFKFFFGLKIFKLLNSSLIFISPCVRLIAITKDKEKSKSNWFENFQTEETFEPQHKIMRVITYICTTAVQGVT